MFRKNILSALLLLSGASLSLDGSGATRLSTPPEAEPCVSRTGRDAILIVPDSVATGLEAGDVVRAYHKGVCAGEATYEAGKALALTVWGDDYMTEGLDGVTEEEPFTLRAHRPGDPAVILELAATIRGSEGEAAPAFGYRTDAILVADLFEVEAASSPVLAVARVSASREQQPNIASSVLDGDMATRWSARGDGERITLELAGPSVVTTLKVAWYRGAARRTRFDVETSADGEAWAQVYSGSSSGTTDALETYDLPNASRLARFVRIVGHGNDENNWTSITEVRLYGVEDVTSAAIAVSKASRSSEAAGDHLASLPTEFAIEQNYPNPFNPSTTIHYQLPAAAEVSLTIYDVAGRRVRQLVGDTQVAGRYAATWDGRDAAGVLVGSGMYVYEIDAGQFRETRTMLLVK